MNGILWAYFRHTEPSTPSVDATALQPASIEERLEIAQNRRFAVAPQPDAADKIGARQVELIFRDRFAPVLEQVTGALTEDFFNPGNRACGIECARGGHNCLLLETRVPL